MRSLHQTLSSWIGKSCRRIVGKKSEVRATPAWRVLYLAAIFEKDQRRVGQRIADAKRALVARARELFAAEGNHLPEESDIDDALLTLHVLERCLLHL